MTNCNFKLALALALALASSHAIACFKPRYYRLRLLRSSFKGPMSNLLGDTNFKNKHLLCVTHRLLSVIKITRRILF